MNKNSKFYKYIVLVALATAFILMIPLLAMQYTDEVVWNLIDFVVAGSLLFGTGFMYLLVTKKAGDIVYRIAVGLALATGLLLIWVNLAVGILGSENNPVNLMYGGVIAVGSLGAVIARFQPKRMATTLFVMALAQMLVPVIALFIWKPETASMEAFLLTWHDKGIVGVVGVNGFFVVLFVGSALLFQYAARKQSLSNTKAKGQPI